MFQMAFALVESQDTRSIKLFRGPIPIELLNRTEDCVMIF